MFEQTARGWTRLYNTPVSDFEAYWFENKSRKTNIYLLRDDDDVCGMVTFKYYDVEYEGRRIVVVKTGVGTLPEARGSNFTARCIATQAVYHAIEHARDEVYVFSTLIHPVTYQIITSFLDTYYPFYDRAQDGELEKLASFLARHFGVQPSNRPEPYIFREARGVVESPTERAYWRQKTNPAVRFFVDKCPDYNAGECFIMVAPIQSRFMFVAFAKLVKMQIRRLTKRYVTNHERR